VEHRHNRVFADVQAGHASWSPVPTLASHRNESKSTTRRRSPRHDVQLDVELSMGGQRFGATTRMLSLGGAFILFHGKPAFNTRIQLRFTLPGHAAAIEVGGLVRWSDERGFGVQFDGLRARDVWTLGRFFGRLE
jgi:hypothetical protein